MQAPQNIRLLLMQEGNWWVAQCLEFDIAAQAKTMLDAISEFKLVWTGRIRACEIEGADPFDLPQAPEFYWKAFEKAPDITFRAERGLKAELPWPLFKSPTPELRVTA